MNDFHQAHGPEHDPHLGELAEELRLLAEVLLERVEPVLRRAAADGRAEWAGCSWCPLCAAAALARGEHHDVVASLAAHGTAIVTVLREALAGVPVEPVMPTDPPEADARESGSGVRDAGAGGGGADVPDTGVSGGARVRGADARTAGVSRADVRTAGMSGADAHSGDAPGAGASGGLPAAGAGGAGVRAAGAGAHSGDARDAGVGPGDVYPGARSGGVGAGDAGADHGSGDGVPQGDSPRGQAGAGGSGDPVVSGGVAADTAQAGRTRSGAAESEARAGAMPAGGARPRYVSIPVQIKV